MWTFHINGVIKQAGFEIVCFHLTLCCQGSSMLWYLLLNNISSCNYPILPVSELWGAFCWGHIYIYSCYEYPRTAFCAVVFSNLPGIARPRGNFIFNFLGHYQTLCLSCMMRQPHWQFMCVSLSPEPRQYLLSFHFFFAFLNNLFNFTLCALVWRCRELEL